MDYIGKYFVREGDPDDFGETIKFVHVKYPEWRCTVEPRIEYRDAVGNVRGLSNMQTAMALVFAGRLFTTNSRRVIEYLRGHSDYRGVKSPMWINQVVDNKEIGGCVEVDKIEEAMLSKRAEVERRIRQELLEERSAMTAEVPATPAPVGGPVPHQVCDNCGMIGAGNFCSQCGQPFTQEAPTPVVEEGRPKRTWACKYCGEEFASGFELGDHKKNCPFREVAQEETQLVLPPVGPTMRRASGTDNVGRMGTPDSGLL